MFCHIRNCALLKTLAEPNRDRQGAEMQEIAAWGRPLPDGRSSDDPQEHV